MFLFFVQRTNFVKKDIHFFSTKSGALCAAKVLTDGKAAYFKLSKAS